MKETGLIRWHGVTVYHQLYHQLAEHCDQKSPLGSDAYTSRDYFSVNFYFVFNMVSIEFVIYCK